MPQRPDDESSRQALREELGRLSKYDGTLRDMPDISARLDRDTYLRMSGLDPTEEVGAEQEANIKRPFQRCWDED